MSLHLKKSGSSGQLEKKRLPLSACKLAPSESADIMEFSGYGAVFNNVDAYGDVIAPGAFSAFLSDVQSGKQDWPAMLMQHGGWGVTSEDITPVGVYSSLTEDEFGLKTAGTLAPTPRGSDAYTLMKMKPRPAISGLSIGYYVRESAYGGKTDPYDRLLKQIDLVEISIVTFPANTLARIGGVKSADNFSEKEFEQILRDVVGLSRKDAKTVIGHGFRHLLALRDADSEELKETAALLRRNASIFKPQTG